MRFPNFHPTSVKGAIKVKTGNGARSNGGMEETCLPFAMRLFRLLFSQTKIGACLSIPSPAEKGKSCGASERGGGWFGSLVGLDEGVGKEGEEEFDEGKGRKGWQKRKRRRRITNICGGNFLRFPPSPCLLIDLFLQREIPMLAIDELRGACNLISLV